MKKKRARDGEAPPRRRKKARAVIATWDACDGTLQTLNANREAAQRYFAPIDNAESAGRCRLWTRGVRDIIVRGRAPAGLADTLKRRVEFAGFISERIDLRETDTAAHVSQDTNQRCTFASCACAVHMSGARSIDGTDPMLGEFGRFTIASITPDRGTCLIHTHSASFLPPCTPEDAVLGPGGGALCTVLGVDAIAPVCIDMRACSCGHVEGAAEITMHGRESASYSIQ